jgi:plastocyanin
MIGTPGRFVKRGVVLGGAALALALALAPVALAAQHAVKIAGFAFAPSTVTVKVGDSVQWTNGDGASHTATADDGSWDTGTIAGGTSKALTFDTAGTFAYHCAIHSSMHGTLVVEAAAATPRPPAGTPPPTDTVPGSASMDETPTLAALFALAVAATLGLALAGRHFRGRV